MVVRVYDSLFVDRMPRVQRVLSGNLGNIAILGSGYTGSGGSGGGGSLGTLPEPGDDVPLPGDTSTLGLSHDDAVIGLKIAVFFDGSTYLYGFPTLPTNCSSFSLSCWIYQEGSQGVLFDTNLHVTDTSPPYSIPDYESMSAICCGTDAILSPVAGSATNPAGPFVNYNGGYYGDPYGQDSTTSVCGNFDWDASEALVDWSHLMISGRRIGAPLGGGFWDATIWIDDTEICTNLSMLQAFAYDSSTGTNLYDLTDLSYTTEQYPDLTGTYHHIANIGGNRRDQGNTNPQPEVNPSGDGLLCGVAEYWLAFNQHIDWSSSTNRLKFHNPPKSGILTGGQYAPCDLGSNGGRPTGTHPQIYLRGGKYQFPINLGAGGTLSVSGVLQTLFTAP